MNSITEKRRYSSPCVTPQALAFQGERLWLSSRDLATLYQLEPGSWKVVEELKPPGVVWAAVSSGDELRLTIGEGANDDRYVYRYRAEGGFEKLFACPDFTGSYLSFDGKGLYLSQWYKGEIHRLDENGKVTRTISVGAEICGHTFARGALYVLRGKENKETPGGTEEWRIARVELGADGSEIADVAMIPFAARSLAFDGEAFWSNHRAGNEVISFRLPE